MALARSHKKPTLNLRRVSGLQLETRLIPHSPVFFLKAKSKKPEIGKYIKHFIVTQGAYDDIIISKANKLSHKNFLKKSVSVEQVSKGCKKLLLSCSTAIFLIKIKAPWQHKSSYKMLAVDAIVRNRCP